MLEGLLPPLTRSEYYALLVTGSWILGFLPLFTRARPNWTWAQCVGLGFVISPFVRLAIGTAYSVDDLVTATVQGDYIVVPPISEVELWNIVVTRLRDFVVLPAIGLLLVWQRVDGLPRRGAPTPVSLGLAATGLAPRASWARDALNGLALFVFIALAYIGAYALLVAALSGALQSTGDESQVFTRITPALILALSIVAGVTEEFLFRGLLLNALSRVMPWLAAALVQAVWFGFVHAGYATWAHVIGPFLFGLGMAWVARTLGILPAILLHAEVNIVAFSLGQYGAYPTESAAILGMLLVANVVALFVTRGEAVRVLWRSIWSRTPRARAN